LALGLYDSLDAKGQAALLDVLGYAGDARAIPLLLRALESGHPDRAWHILRFTFAESPGVAEAVEKYRPRAPPETRYQAARRLGSAGRKLYLDAACDPKESDYVRVHSVLDLDPPPSAAERARLKPALRPLLERLVSTGNYIELRDAARILRWIPDLDLLLRILERTDFVYTDTPQIAALAVVEMGAAGRAKPKHELARAWLGHETTAALAPIAAISRQKDEGLYLTGLIGAALPAEALAWVAFRLGDLKERRAVPALFGILETRHYVVSQAAVEALENIGGAEVEARALRLIDQPKVKEHRRTGVDLLFKLQGERCLPALRRLIHDSDAGVKTSALAALGRAGTRA
ncbi:MAG: HEAT repeat domain-containing protein, partial [Bryobacteraceae bacterium]